jgi:hypothetical protein
MTGTPHEEMDRLEAMIEGDYRPPSRDPFDIESDRLFGGISGVPVPADDFPLGHGLIIRRTYAKLTAPYILAFAPPPKPSAPNPGPWAAVGEKSLVILAELELDGEPTLGFDRLNTLWFVVALLRLKLALPVKMPILSDRPFQRIPDDTDRANIFPVELQLQQLLTAPPANVPSAADFEWLRDNLFAASELMKDPVFHRSFQTLDGAIHTQNAGAGIVIAWAAIETLIRPGNTRITERICRSLAAYLNGPGPDRDRAFATIERCYAARGGAVHAGNPPEAEQFHTAFRLARSALLLTIERRERPDIDELLEAWRMKSPA